MPKIDFYILKDNAESARENFACKLIEKVYHLSHRVYVKVDNKADATKLDDILWTFRDGSFIPHEIEHSEQQHANLTPVVIGYETPKPGKYDVLVNLSSNIPDTLESFNRVAEIVGGSEPIRALARDRFRQYRDRGLELESHQI